MSIRILLADDNCIFVSAVRQFLERVPGTEVVARAHSGREALAMARLLSPDVALLDVSMPDMSGLDVAREMKTWPHSPHIVFLSMHDGAAYRSMARAIGAAGYVGKTDFVVDLLPMLENLVMGSATFVRAARDRE